MTPLPFAPDIPLQDMRRHADPLADGTIARILGDWPAQGWPTDDAPQWRRIAEVNRLFGEWGTTPASRTGMHPAPCSDKRLPRH